MTAPAFFASICGAPAAPRARPPAQVAARLCALAALSAAAAFGVPLGELRAATRRAPHVAFARQSAMYLAHVVFGLSLSDVGRAFGRDRTTAAYACALVEDRRDDPALDAMLDALAAACESLGRKFVVAPDRGEWA